MSTRAFIIAGDRLLTIANPEGAALNYHARAFTLAPDAQSAAQHNSRADTVIAVTDGILEVMINGAVTHVAAGDYIRVRAGLHFAWRNPGTRMARLLLRTCRCHRDAHRICISLGINAA